jgi:hypothetical protein
MTIGAEHQVERYVGNHEILMRFITLLSWRVVERSNF